MAVLSKRSMKPSGFKRTHEVKLGDVVEFEYELPEPPKSYKDIANWNLPINKQRWIIPSEILTQSQYEELDAEEATDYLVKIMDWRINGYWFYNHGNIEYLTGDHFFYLAFWRIDGVVPYWKDSDSTFFYIERYCQLKKDCYGWMQVTNRRDGKTGKATSIIYNRITLNYNANGGIQSKTLKDGKVIFGKLIKSWQKLPPYLRPEDSGDTNPSQILKFVEPAKRSSKGEKKIYKEVLNSQIDYLSAVDNAYDGTKLKYYYDDEYGKTTEVDVLERWNIVRECLVQGRNIVGKSLHTTTAEEMEDKGGQAAKNLWDESDIHEAVKLGRDMTISGLLRWFKPATHGLEGFIDSYGYSIVEDPKKPILGIDGAMIEIGSKSYISRERLGKSGSTLAGEKRKYPLTIDEAFIEEGKESPFDIIKLNEQLSHCGTLSNKLIKGNFVWLDKKDKQVGWQPTETGRWSVLWMPPVADRNKLVADRRGYKPSNYLKAVSGVDPFDHKTTTDGKKSNAASYVYRKYNAWDSETSDCFVCEYVNRPATPDMFYDDMVKQSVFYGIELLAENNKPGIVNYFENNGFSHYLMDRPPLTHTESSKRQKEKGIPMSGEQPRTLAVETTETYVYKNTGLNYDDGTYGNVFFPKLLKCWIKFNPQKWTDYDEFVGAALCLLAKDRYIRTKSVKSGREVSRYIKSYKRKR